MGLESRRWVLCISLITLRLLPLQLRGGLSWLLFFSALLLGKFKPCLIGHFFSVDWFGVYIGAHCNWQFRFCDVESCLLLLHLWIEVLFCLWITDKLIMIVCLQKFQLSYYSSIRSKYNRLVWGIHYLVYAVSYKIDEK